MATSLSIVQVVPCKLLICTISRGLTNVLSNVVYGNVFIDCTSCPIQVTDIYF